MLFNILIVLLVAAVVYFHYAQGFFSSMISMVLAIFAGTFAVSLHEWIIASLLGGAAADYAVALVLCGTFAAVYIVGRLIFDFLVPGNVQVPVTFDRIGAILCGFVAAIFGVGNVALAAQSLPTGHSFMTFTRYEFELRDNVRYPAEGRRRTLDANEFMIANDPPRPEDERGLWLPVDQWLASFVAFQSSAGPLSGFGDFASVHPNFPLELQNQRIGIEPGAKITALNLAGRQFVNVDGVFSMDRVRQIDHDPIEARDRGLPPEVVAGSGEFLLVVRTVVDANTADKGKLMRFSPAAVRLVAAGQEFHPLGTLERGRVLVSNRFDDSLFVHFDNGQTSTIDLVFRVPRDTVSTGDGSGGFAMKPGAFLEFKRFGRVSLAEMRITPGLGQSIPASGVIRKKLVMDRIEGRNP